METYGTYADFLSVYIREAHACDQWPLGKAVVIPQHQSLSDRLAAAKRFQSENSYKPTLLVDTMENKFDGEYASWPERAYIIHQGKMMYICNLSPEGALDWEDGIEEWLASQFPQAVEKSQAQDSL